MANKRISTTELEFDQIKANLKSFMQGQSEFADYDFEGSALSTLLDVLAYNTHYNALYKNLAVNESFLDSASKRSSVVSRAKEVGYIPKSAQCSTATIDIVVSNTSTKPTTLILPAYSAFQAYVDGNTYTFYTLDDTITTLSGSTYTFSNVTIKEGSAFQYKYSVFDGLRYVIPNEVVDLTTLRVRVQENANTGTFTTFINNESILNLTATDAVYFIKEIDGELYELEFGNDIIGKALQTGNVVNLSYLTTSKDLPNGANTFSYNGSSLLGGTVTVATITNASGGSDIEDVESIRYNAPRAYSTQNRAVTEDDYRTIIYRNFSEAESVSVWGGESNDPPVYGKVFISIKPKNSSALTNAQKQQLTGEILKSKNVVSITPEVVDAEYINMEMTVSVYYNPRLTSKSATDLQSDVYKTIQDYNDLNLNKFDGIFRYSQLSTLIDSTNESFVSNISTIKFHREVNVQYGLSSNYYINLANPIYNSGVPEHSVLSTGFYVAGDTTNLMYIEDLPVSGSNIGKLRTFYYVDTNKYYVKEVGTVDYSKGIIDIIGLNIASIDTTFGGILEFIIKPQSNDVVSVRNQLVTIPANQVTVNIILDKTVSGDSAGNTNYIFSSSRN